MIDNTKKEFDLVIVIPLGPGNEPDFITDTIDSLYHYIDSSFRIIIADDSQQKLGELIRKRFPDVDLLVNAKNKGRYGGLYITLSNAFRYAIENYRFKALFRLDTDALVIGKAPEKEVFELFATNADAGIAGQYGIEYNGQPSNYAWPRRRLVKNLMTWKFIRRPITNWILKKHYKRAVKKGYVTGENVFGGAYFISEACLQTLYKEGLLPERWLRNAALEEDHIFSLLAKAVGYQLYDLSKGCLPFGCKLRGLPDSPENLVASGKRIIHSTRHWNGIKEKQIRDYFRRYRVTVNT